MYCGVMGDVSVCIVCWTKHTVSKHQYGIDVMRGSLDMTMEVVLVEEIIL
jgi:hypothetical protein